MKSFLFLKKIKGKREKLNLKIVGETIVCSFLAAVVVILFSFGCGGVSYGWCKQCLYVVVYYTCGIFYARRGREEKYRSYLPFFFCTALFRYSRIFIISPRTTDFALQVAKTSSLLAPRAAISCGKVGQLGKTCLFSAAPVGFLNLRFKICGRYVGKEDEGGRAGENYFRFPFSASVYVFMR